MQALGVVWRLGLLIGFAIAVPGLSTAAQTTPPKEAQRAEPELRTLRGEDAKRAQQLDEQIDEAIKADRWNDAIVLAQELLALRMRAQGKHAQAQPLLEKALEIRRRLLTKVRSPADRAAGQGPGRHRRRPAAGQVADRPGRRSCWWVIRIEPGEFATPHSFDSSELLLSPTPRVFLQEPMTVPEFQGESLWSAPLPR